MKKIYLLSGPGSTQGFSNEITIKLKEDLKGKNSVVFIASSPSSYDENDMYVNGNNDTVVGLKNHLKQVMDIKDITVIDERINKKNAKESILSADVVYLLGGNPLTQLEYIKSNEFDQVLREYDGIILGTSAGAMNMAKYGYYSKDKDCLNTFFYDALGIVDVTIDPHFDIENKEQVKDALIFSKEHVIVGVPNSSAICFNDGKTEYIGQCYIFEDGMMTVKNKRR